MKDRLMFNLGVFGVVLYYIIRIIVAVLPFVMIGLGFWGTSVLLFINSTIPLTTIVFWIWGLIAAIGGKQDFWAILYYISFAIIYIPFFVDLVSGFFYDLRNNL